MVLHSVFSNRTIHLLNGMNNSLCARLIVVGDGVLSRLEFLKLLKGFQVHLSDDELHLLISQFDKNGDGFIDMYAFKEFIEEEVNKLQNDNSELSQASEGLTEVKALSNIQSTTSLKESLNFNGMRKGAQQSRKNMNSTNHNYDDLKCYEQNRSTFWNEPLNSSAMLNDILRAQEEIESKLGVEYYYK